MARIQNNAHFDVLEERIVVGKYTFTNSKLDPNCASGLHERILKLIQLVRIKLKIIGGLKFVIIYLILE
jgi:hypothetical protein